MLIVFGASGHIGNALCTRLLAQGKQVLALTRDAQRAEQFVKRGAEAAIIDVQDTDGLRSVLRRGKRAFLLNPPAPVSSDTDKEEHRTARAILQALQGVSLEKVVLQSTYGAQPGDYIGDLSVLFELEQGLRRQSTPLSILRAAYYMSNWDQMLTPAKQGKLLTMFPADFRLPMVAPDDIAAAAAELLTAPPEPYAIHYVEGPDMYTPSDVAKAFSASLERSVELDVIPREKWEQTFLNLGFSPEAALSFRRMTALTIDSGPEKPRSPRKGRTSLQVYVRDLIIRSEMKSK
ncbi:NmrA family NAD(P)-binding protein [Occallatibacter riparius]|uniref:NmrA family NAD(P)-binding protein n=1 Tax=Occallatibacter riparius TaxID=1002689 RepID=A0A9J7BTX7_9BACT|nr:NmrA family NAD(P)-binding protein [Occallatibacter riparius]UWZ84445.1 NmrA family NAD(P)-binding protein [Occallatibacter riparius]